MIIVTPYLNAVKSAEIALDICNT